MRAFNGVGGASPRRAMGLATPALGASAALALFVGLAAPAWAWTDPFGDWTAGGYLQAIEINRPTDGRPPYGALDSNADGADGYTWDGLQFRDLDVNLAGPLGWTGTSAVLEAQVYLSVASAADLYVQDQGSWGRFRAGNVYLPFGVEQQTSKTGLVTIQRSLIYGFENYGHTEPWGLQLMNQRGWGLRWDKDRAWGPLRGGVGASVQDFNGGYLYQNAVGGVARAGLDWTRGPWSVEAGASGLLARGELLTQPADFAPLGAPQGAAFVPSAVLGGHKTISTGGTDLEVGAGPVHARVELAEQSLGPLPRGGGEATAWLDLEPGLRALGAPKPWRTVRVYGKWEQAYSSFGDDVHQAGALYRAATYGLGLPTGWNAATLRLEYLQVTSDSFGGALPDGRVFQAQLQFVL